MRLRGWFTIVSIFTVWVFSMSSGRGQIWTRSILAGKSTPQLVSAQELPPHGTFWLLTRTNSAPLPFYPPFLNELDTPVYSLDAQRGVYLVDDSQVDWQAINQIREANRLLRRLDWESGAMSDQEYFALEGGSPESAAYSYPTSSLWLEIICVTNELASIIVHGTEPDESYALLSKENLTNATWLTEQIVVGTNGQDWTPTTAPVLNRTNELFFWAVSLKDSDGDLIPDFWELEHGLNPNDPTDASADPDNDGYTNLDEFLLGQNPHVSDPPRPNITVVATDANAAEPNNPGIFTLTRSGVTTRALTVYYTVFGLARPGADHVALNGEALFVVGQSTATVTVQPMDDSSYEGTEHLTMQILPGIHYQNGTNEVATVMIADDEKQPIRVAATLAEVFEGSGTNGVFSFLREGDTRLPLTVNFTLTGTATNGVHYQTLPTSITFASGADTTNLTVIPVNNTNYSGMTTGIVTLLPNSAYRIETNAGNDTLVFRDNDLPAVNITATDADAREASLNPGRFAISRTGATQETLTVFYRVSGTADMGGGTNFLGDYQPLPGIVVLSAGQSSAFVDIVPVQNTNPEPMETVLLTLAGSENYRIGTSNSATVNIDDDEALTYVITVERPSIYPTPRPGIIHITRTGSALAASSLAWSVTDINGTPLNNGTFSATGDFLNGNLYFPANRSTVSVKLQHLSGAITNMQFRFAGQIATVPCWGQERLIEIRPDVLRTYSSEGDSGIKARFYLSRGANGPGMQVKLRLEGTATAGADFSQTNLITFGNNVTSQTIDIHALPDGFTEGWESVIVRLDFSDLSYAPYNPSVSANDFQETYAVLWLGDPGLSGPRPDADVDGDLLTDTFETAHGMNPLIADDYQADADKDGMSLLDEQSAGTSPVQPDTDSDALADYMEWTFGSNPTNAAQNTLLSRDEYVGVTFSVASCFHCHQATLNVGSYQLKSTLPVAGQPVERMRQEKVFQLAKGFSYPVTITGSITSSTGTYTAMLEVPTNGIWPEFFVKDANGMLGTNRPANTLAGKVASVIVPKLELTWTNKGDNLTLDMNTNASSDEVLGNRIFVGAKTPTENLPRNTVLLKIKTTPPLAGSNVWLRSFDVDDTTDEIRLDNNGVIDTNGRSGGDNAYEFLPPYGYGGLFVANSSSSLTTTLNSSGEALVEMRVGMQPGDNYRIAATVFPTNNLTSLQTTNETTGGFVPANAGEVKGGFNGALSPLLTVWRKLHLEIDSMTSVPTNGPQANFLSTKVITLKTNYPNAEQTAVYYRASSYPLQTNRYENGTLTIPGIANYQVIVGQGADYNWQFNNYLNYVVVQGTIPSSAVGTPAQLRDDDDRLKADLQLPSLPMDAFSLQIIAGKNLVFSTNKMVRGVAAVYRPAFIDVVDANASGWNTGRTIPFFLNKDVFDNPWTLSGIFDSAKNVFDSSVFWAHTVTIGYQPKFSEDRDNNDESALLGTTAESLTAVAFGYSAIYDETIRDYAYDGRESNYYLPLNYRLLEHSYYGWLFGTIAHEMGHAPGNGFENLTDHAEKYLMQKGGDEISKDFAPASIKRFRSSTSWRAGTP